MAFWLIQNSLASGEFSPSLFGRTDLQKYHAACSTMRNFFVNYRGGASSRAGLAYIGMSKQGAPNIGGTPTNNPPRDIPFQFNINQGFVLEFGDQYMRIISQGAYVLEASQNVTSVSIAGLFTVPAHGFAVGDWIFDLGNPGFSGLQWIVATVPSANTFTVTDLFGAVITVATASVGGTVARIYTVDAPYAAIDLPFLKYTQNQDTMSFTCINQESFFEYPTYDLTRFSDTDWDFTPTVFTSSIPAPPIPVVVAHSSTTPDTFYSYIVTAVSASGEESVASPPKSVENNNISINAGSNTITWATVTGATSYNIYRATPSYTVDVPIGALYYFVGTAFGTQFTDTNIQSDSTIVPPTHQDPFARGIIEAVIITAPGSGYTQAGVTYTETTSTGSGFTGTPVVVGDAIVGFYIQNNGENYLPGDTITFTGDGTGATATLTIGPETGTYPGTVAYFQQRRFYGYTIEEPNTFFASQPGFYRNMDSSIPLVASDAIVATPWAQQINGIQFFVPITQSLLILTGNGAWSLTGGNNVEVTPIDETASSQAYNGCNSHVQPIVINYDILYVQAKGSIVRDLSYNFFVNIYTGTDKTIYSSHLFNFRQIQQWAYAEEPYKVVWAIRDDGTMLSLTYLKEQEIDGWARHDTNGLFVGVCSITEPPVDAVYLKVKRYIQGPGVWVYYSERMDNRNWQTVEDCFCIDAGLSYPTSYPNAILTPAAATGTRNISDVNLIDGGSGYISPVITVFDPLGTGSGATFSPTVVGGVITAIAVLTEGINYSQGSSLVFTDIVGGGSNAVAQPIITNNVHFTASSSVFNSGMVGDVIRIGNNNASSINNFEITASGGGQATITSFISSTEVIADITQPITNIIPNDPTKMPAPVNPDQWSLSVPTTVVSGLNHLEGMEVSILADGGVVDNQIVTDGQIVLPQAASSIKVGLPFLAQLQTVYLDPPDAHTSQGKRKNIYAVTVRMDKSRGVQVGTNQIDQSTQPTNAPVDWVNMKEIKQRNASISAGSAIPLFTGDERILVPANWDKPGQIAVQASFPLPVNVTALICEYMIGDTSG